MAMFACMLEHGRLKFALIIGGSGGVFVEASCSCSLCFTDISAWTRCGIGASAGNMVNVTNSFFFFYFFYSRIDPLVVMDVLRPLELNSLAKGLVTPEKKGRLKFTNRFLLESVGRGGGGLASPSD